MIQALAALVGAILTVAACYAAGAMLLDRLGIELRRYERVPLAFTLGAACLHLTVFAILAAHAAYWPVFLGLLLGLIAASLLNRSWFLRGDPGESISQNLKRVAILTFTPFTVLYFFHAWAPEMSPDGSGYHLGWVLRYLDAHRFLRVTTDMYAALSGGVEMVFVPAFSIGRHSAAALVHLAFTIALALAMFAYGRRLGRPWVGAAGALLTYASPVVGIDGSSAYIDLGTAAAVFSAFYWLEMWDEGRKQRLLIPAGIMAGYACATKYTAFVIVLLALGWVVWRTRHWRPFVTVALYSSLMVAPWLVKNWIILKNPIAPFGNTIFRNPYFHPIFESQYTDAMQGYGVQNKWALPLEVTIRGDKTEGLLGVIFLAAPLALLSLRFRAGRRLLLAALLLGLPYYLNLGTRFLIPPLPFVSLAMALALTSLPLALAAIMLFHAFFSWPSEVHHFSAPYVWKLDRILYREALRIVPQDEYLRSVSMEYSAARMVEQYVPKEETILATHDIPSAYCDRKFIDSYTSGLSQELLDIINVGWIGDFQPSVTGTFQFPEQSVRRIRVLQTATVKAREILWGVHELRFFDHGKELPRLPDWRLRAWPNPWDVQYAFDNSLATRWQTWEQVKPGDYLDVDFGRDVPLDQVVLDTNPPEEEIQLQVEAMDSSGHWRLLAKDPKWALADLSHYSMRLAATHEMALRGLHYLLVGDDYAGVDDIGDDPEAWGLTEIAAGYGVRLYKLAP